MAMIDPRIDASDDHVLSIVRPSLAAVDLSANKTLNSQYAEQSRFVPVVLEQGGIAVSRPIQHTSIWARYGKRPVECLLAILLTVGISPLLITLMLVIRLSSPGPVFFRQVRVGQGGAKFRIWKFRTMVTNAEQLLKINAELGAQHNGNWKIHDDPRVTTIGRFLRKTSLDELPQLFNVIVGHMSLIGPRPVQPGELIQQYGAVAPVITSIRPGMTGLWQISGRSLLSYSDRVRLDIEYVYNLSFTEDSRILLKTIPSILRGHGAV
jgi:lipopolysaccharide/colanic/teichoic acid biosynthesis glycosyltransferase